MRRLTGSLTTTQRRLLAAAYAKLDAVWEGYYVPKKLEKY